MLNLEVKTRKDPAEVKRELREFFGGRFGLEAEDTEHGLLFSGGGGFVEAEVDGGEETKVELHTREFEEPVREFASRL